ncbi:MAG: hypothetical protein D6784_11165 [Chloroflexi bacterium]|nr:MAG: hypothetical protein D6784_11165 [Chloroflexota bacterium]
MLEKHFPRLWSLDAGQVMVVTDLHGDGDAYRRCRDRFVDLQAAGRADYLVLTGDLIHRSDGGPDESLEMVLDVLALQAEYGEAVIYLCGNHELPHIYGIDLARGDESFTPVFETALTRSGRRDEVAALFESLPFYLRTRAGVSLAHAGAPAEAAAPGSARRLFLWNHRELLDWAEDIIGSQENAALMRRRLFDHHYDTLARRYLGVSGPEDTRYNHLLRGVLASQHPDFAGLLWPALFTRCEEEYGAEDYAIFVHALLAELSEGYWRQELLVSGHLTTRGGWQKVGRQLRLSSAAHARPRHRGSYLLFDAARPVKNIDALATGIQRVFD